MTPHHTIETPRSRAGAIAVIRLVHDRPEPIGLPAIRVNQVKLADLWGIDEGVVTRIDQASLLLMPHGGVAIVRQISNKLDALGAPLLEHDDPVRAYPEAGSPIEAHMLHALARAASPDAIDVLLKHARRWEALGAGAVEDAAGIEHSAHETQLARLIAPPLVAAVGRANVGKSTLLNALAGARVALVADLAGTTRDHVGASVDLSGLVVRWVDTPGIDDRITDAQEIGLSLRVVQGADLIVHCVDQGGDDGQLDPRLTRAITPQTPVVRVGTRADLGDHASATDARVALGDGRRDGLGELVGLLKSTLISPEALGDPRPWRFWLGPDGG